MILSFFNFVHKIEKTILFFLIVAYPIFFSCSKHERLPIPTDEKTLTLSKDGKTNYLIVLPDVPTPVERTAAKELREHLNKITGANFIVSSESKVDPSQPMLVVGNSNIAQSLLPTIDASKLLYDGIVIGTVGENVIMLGHPKRGTLYAVNTFLEKAIGVRWWTSTESYIPKAETLIVPKLHINYSPQLIYREAFYKDALSDDVFATRMKCNGDHSKIKPEYGDYHKFQYFVHSFYLILPPNKYFGQNPEWYSLINGRRVNQGAQLCLTNVAMRNEFIKNVLRTLRTNKNAGFISISQNDGLGACQCDNCQAIVKEEGSESGPIIRFVNVVAEEIEKYYPDIWVETLAYYYSSKAPLKVKPRKNVVVRLATYLASFSEPLGEGEQNIPTREDIESWSKITDNLFIWNYVTNFVSYIMPHPNLHTLAPNLRFFVENNAIGLFEQGDFYCDAGDFVRMRNWVNSQLMWNPNQDEKKLIDEFFVGYYGEKAAPYLRKYWDILTQSVMDAKPYLRCVMHDTSGWLTIPTYAKAASMMKNAINETEDKTLIKRLRREEIPLKFVLLLEYQRFKTYEIQNGNSPVVLPDPEKALTEFMALLKEFNVTMVKEDFSPNANHTIWLENFLRGKLFP